MTELERTLFNALRDLVTVLGRTGNAYADFEIQAQRFYAETGLICPGKDVPAYFGVDNREHRQAVYDAWVERKIDAARAAVNEVRGL